MSSEAKTMVTSALASLLVSLVLFGVAFHYYYQPELDRQSQQINLLQEEYESKFRLQVTIISASWAVSGDEACVVMADKTILNVLVTNPTSQLIQVIRLKLVFSSGNSSVGVTLEPPTPSGWALEAGGNFSTKYDAGGLYDAFRGHLVSLSIEAIIVQFATQTTDFCLLFGNPGLDALNAYQSNLKNPLRWFIV